MGDLICLNFDAESENGSRLARQFGVTGYPGLLFLNSDGSPRDWIGGFLPVEPFHAEVSRIKSGKGTINAFEAAIEKDPEELYARFDLIEKLKGFNAKAAIEAQLTEIGRLVRSGIGFDGQSVECVWELYQNLKLVGMDDLALVQVKSLRRLDPEGKSLALRSLAFDDLMQNLKGTQGLEAIRDFLAVETHEEILFDGWYAIYSAHDSAAKRTRKREEHKLRRRSAREAAVTLWKHTPEKYRGNLGNAIAWGYYEDAKDLNAKQRQFAIEVARIAVKASNNNVAVIDTLACCLFIAGQLEEAMEHIDTCITLDPENRVWRERKVLFTKS